MKRLITAFLLAPLAPAVLLCIFFYILAFGHESEEGFLLAIAIVAPFFAYAVTLIGGLPLFLLLKRRSSSLMQRSFYSIGLAALPGLLASVAFVFLLDDDWSKLRFDDWSPFSFIGIATIYGAVSGYVFWRIARPALLTKAPVHA